MELLLSSSPLMGGDSSDPSLSPRFPSLESRDDGSSGGGGRGSVGRGEEGESESGDEMEPQELLGHVSHQVEERERDSERERERQGDRETHTQRNHLSSSLPLPHTVLPATLVHSSGGVRLIGVLGPIPLAFLLIFTIVSWPTSAQWGDLDTMQLSLFGIFFMSFLFVAGRILYSGTEQRIYRSLSFYHSGEVVENVEHLWLFGPSFLSLPSLARRKHFRRKFSSSQLSRCDVTYSSYSIGFGQSRRVMYQNIYSIEFRTCLTSSETSHLPPPPPPPPLSSSSPSLPPPPPSSFNPSHISLPSESRPSRPPVVNDEEEDIGVELPAWEREREDRERVLSPDHPPSLSLPSIPRPTSSQLLVFGVDYDHSRVHTLLNICLSGSPHGLQLSPPPHNVTALIDRDGALDEEEEEEQHLLDGETYTRYHGDNNGDSAEVNESDHFSSLSRSSSLV